MRLEYKVALGVLPLVFHSPAARTCSTISPQLIGLPCFLSTAMAWSTSPLRRSFLGCFAFDAALAIFDAFFLVVLILDICVLLKRVRSFAPRTHAATCD